MPTLDTKYDVVERVKDVRDQFKVLNPRVKARDIALAIYDAFIFSPSLQRVLLIDALTAIARSVIQYDRAHTREHERAHEAASDAARGTLTFPEFEEICRDCPSNYALPGEDPEDTVYLETFDNEFECLRPGFKYLEKMAEGTARNARALRSLYDLCVRLGAKPHETPRELLLRKYGFDP